MDRRTPEPRGHARTSGPSFRGPPLRLLPPRAGIATRGGAAALVVGLATGGLLGPATGGLLGQEPPSDPAADGFRSPPPVAQSALHGQEGVERRPVSLRDASRPDPWLGVEVRDVRWAPDGSGVFFRWHPEPEPDQDPELDPWFFVDGEGEEVRTVPEGEVHRIPSAALSWSRDRDRAAWVRDGRVYLYVRGAGGGETGAGGTGAATGAATRGAAADEAPGLAGVRAVFSGPGRAVSAEMAPDGAHVDFLVDEELFRYDLTDGSVRQLTRRHEVDPGPEREIQEWLRDQQLQLFRQHREDRERDRAREAGARARDGEAPQAIPVEPGADISHVRISPDGRWVTFRWTRPAADRESVRYAHYASPTGYTETHDARPKIGEPRDEHRMGIVEVDPRMDPDSVEVRWVELPDADGRPTLVHGPYYSPDGGRAVVQALSRDHEDLWIAELNPATGEATTLTHDHDPAWLGGPPPQAGSLQPALLEWLDEDRFVFASERTGWSHLHLAVLDGNETGAAATVRPLTEGTWEVRDAELSPEDDFWLLAGSREHPSDDHLYLLPADGGELRRISEGAGRFAGHLSPDGRRLAVVRSGATALPDLYLRAVDPLGADGRASGERLGPDGMTRITASGTDAYHERLLVEPEMVSFPHPDGDPVWAALFLPPERGPESAAVLHIHGGGYRQFAHRGWSVYGWAQHVGFINHLLAQGYVVLDFDYRGSAGFGRDYRTDIHRAMGHSDVDGAVAAVDWLADEHGVDPGRVGMYGLSYGGFFTLMALFRHPGVFAAGVSDDGVTDWAHYSDGWTSRILNLPQDDPEAFERSSPIHHAEGLEDPLLISHGVIDDNVHFQDAVRLVQRLIELEKDFEVIYYPLERHGFRTESSRYDYYRRVDAHFRRHLLDR